MTKYLMILSHGVIQFGEFVFCCPLQSELSIDKFDSFLSFTKPFYFSVFVVVLLPHLVSFSQYLCHPWIVSKINKNSQ